MTTIYMDLETVGCDDPAVVADITAGIAPPKNMSKPETIAKWESEEKPALVDEAVKKTSFDGGLGRIVCIGYAMDDAQPVVYANDTNEPALLTPFFNDIKRAAELHYRGGKTERHIVFCGHNISGFDLRFLWQRSVCNAIRPPSAIPFKAKPWDATIADTMLMWHPDRDRRISLDRLCRTLQVASPKSAMDGSMVWPYVKAGRIKEVADYCKNDVIAVRACYKRMVFSGAPA